MGFAAFKGFEICHDSLKRECRHVSLDRMWGSGGKGAGGTRAVW